MPNVNKVFLMGNLTRDPELRGRDDSVCGFGMAVNRKWMSADGEDKSEVLFIDCTIFGKRAPIFARYVHKGDPIHIEGRLKLDQWEAQDGSARSKICVIVENFEFIRGKGGGDGGDDRSERQSDNGFGGRPDTQPPVDMDDGDIPF